MPRFPLRICVRPYSGSNEAKRRKYLDLHGLSCSPRISRRALGLSYSTSARVSPRAGESAPMVKPAILVLELLRCRECTTAWALVPRTPTLVNQDVRRKIPALTAGGMDLW